MCTVTFVPAPGDFYITSNRDNKLFTVSITSIASANGDIKMLYHDLRTNDFTSTGFVKGIRHKLVPYGNHSRGSKFVDWSDRLLGSRQVLLNWVVGIALLITALTQLYKNFFKVPVKGMMYER